MFMFYNSDSVTRFLVLLFQQLFFKVILDFSTSSLVLFTPPFICIAYIARKKRQFLPICKLQSLSCL